MKKCALLIAVLFFAISCKNQVKNEAVVYSNDFEKNDLQGITNGVIEKFNSTNVLGRYNNGNFSLVLNNLPKHDLVTISFDLYIHDSWDGNKKEPDGPDIWQMVVDGNVFINTTFSNDAFIAGNFTSPQSYPFNYPNNYNNPKTGAYRTDLPSACDTVGPKITSQYKISKTLNHKSSTLQLQCLDKLIQRNAANPKCDESWSVDNITVTTITL
ncbi:hypothetical protein [Mucilaginibacter sp. UR6-11]|uniref:hypothetical protein n=1 Tax=Mucilaginibacter sp. UR6-11 TaxID=1435644 RepID=UPI001E59F174|nr:hypothetical protein [Mucilaginibacter sp. UR6-11]MCC8423968.1 hypothetical protein [Mucilaginibacter sp. UR6-11]